VKPYEFSTDRTAESTKPLTYGDLEHLLDELRRPVEERPQPTHDIDFAKVAEHGIQMGWDGLAEMWMMSSSEMARAKSVGAIRPLPRL
jgi:hypothetical protein